MREPEIVSVECCQAVGVGLLLVAVCPKTISQPSSPFGDELESSCVHWLLLCLLLQCPETPNRKASMDGPSPLQPPDPGRNSSKSTVGSINAPPHCTALHWHGRQVQLTP